MRQRLAWSLRRHGWAALGGEGGAQAVFRSRRGEGKEPVVGART